MSNNTLIPLWKQLGYSSQAEYIQALNSKKAPTSEVGISPKLPSLNNYASAMNPSIGKIPSFDNSAIRKGMLDSSRVGIIGGGGVPGGVTKEGVIIGGNSGNLEKMPTILPSKPSGTTASSNPLDKYLQLTKGNPQTPIQQPTSNPAPLATETETQGGRTDAGSYNGTNDFLEMFKENYGYDYDGSPLTRREGMSDSVWNVLKNLYGYYQQGLNDESQKAADEENRNSYYDSQLESLLEQYRASQESLDKSKSQAQQAASITLDKLKKYLPAQVKAQGLGGLGVSETSQLQAYNNYANTMGNIESDYQANKTSLDTNKTSATNELEQYRQNDLQSIADKYNEATASRKELAGSTSKNIFEGTQADNYETLKGIISGASDETTDALFQQIMSGDINEEQKNLLKMLATSVAQGNVTKRQDSTYNNYLSTIANLTDRSVESAYAAIDRLDITDEQKAKLKAQVNSRVSANQEQYRKDMRDEALQYFQSYEGDWDNAKKVLDSYRQYLTEDEYNTRLNYINSQVEAEKKAEEESQIEKDNRITSGQETFTYNGGTYQITSQLKSDANEIKRNNDFKDQLKAKCGTTDPYDASKIPNGTTFEIEADNRGSNDFNFWDDIGAFLFSPLGAGAWDSWGNWNTLYVTFYNGQWYRSDKKV